MDGIALIFHPNTDTPETQRFTHWRDCTLDYLQQAVGGYIELVPHFETFDAGDARVVPCIVYSNEYGKINRLPINALATRMWNSALGRAGLYNDAEDYLSGPIVVILGDDEFLRGHSQGEEEPEPDPGSDNANCVHEWAYTGEAYGGDEPGEGRCYCVYCGADGDA